MDPKILEYMSSQNISCLTTLLKDNSPHAATLHFSHSENPFELYFSTENTSRKCEALLSGETVKGSCVLGFSEQDFRTLQMDGEVALVTDSDELTKIKEIHYAKHPSSKKYENAPETVFLKFVPNWFRYTDYTTKPLTIITK